MKKYIVLVLFLLAYTLVRADNQVVLPDNYGYSSQGEDFVIAYFPTDISAIANADYVNVYLYSEVSTEVRMYVPNTLDDTPIDSTVQVPAFELIKVQLESAFLIPLVKSLKSPPPGQHLYRGTSLVVEAKDPVYCWSIMEGQFRAEGMQVIPRQSLSTEYIVSAGSDYRPVEKDEVNSSYVCIAAVHDDTRVYITIGGAENNSVAAVAGKDISTGDQLQVDLEKGDVYVFGTEHEFNDLSGTIITATQPVAVYQGNTNLYNNSDENGDNPQYSIEPSMPLNSWGKTYYGFSFAKEPNYQTMSKVTAGQSDVTVYQDENLVSVLETKGGKIDKAYKTLENIGRNRFSAYLADKPISVSVFEVNSKKTFPFQLNLIPEEQFMTDYLVFVPAEQHFYQRYINLVFKSLNSKSIPDDVKLGLYEDGEYVMKKASEYKVVKLENHGATKYMSAMIEVREGGVFKVHSNEPSAAYSYGYGDRRSYAFTGETQFKKFDMTDDVTPPVIDHKLKGNKVTGTVIDATENPTGLGNPVFMDYLSSNIDFEIEPYQIGTSKKVDFSMLIADMEVPAHAVVYFYDVVGNMTPLKFDYYPDDTSEPEYSHDQNFDKETRTWNIKGYVLDLPTEEAIKSGIDTVKFENENPNCEVVLEPYDKCSKDTVYYSINILDYKTAIEEKLLFIDCAGNSATPLFKTIADTAKPICSYTYKQDSSVITGYFKEPPMMIDDLEEKMFMFLDSIIVVSAVNVNVDDFDKFKPAERSKFEFNLYQIDIEKDGTAEVRVVDFCGNSEIFTFLFPKKDVGVVDDAKSFKVYPNPANEVLNIEFIENIGVYEVYIYNLSGENVYFANELSKGSLNIKIDNLTSGGYILEVRSLKGREKIKFVKY